MTARRKVTTKISLTRWNWEDPFCSMVPDPSRLCNTYVFPEGSHGPGTSRKR